MILAEAVSDAEFRSRFPLQWGTTGIAIPAINAPTA